MKTDGEVRGVLLPTTSWTLIGAAACVTTAPAAPNLRASRIDNADVTLNLTIGDVFDVSWLILFYTDRDAIDTENVEMLLQRPRLLRLPSQQLINWVNVFRFEFVTKDVTVELHRHISRGGREITKHDRSERHSNTRPPRAGAFRFVRLGGLRGSNEASRRRLSRPRARDPAPV